MGQTSRAEFSLTAQRWTPAELPPMDSPRTLVLAFGAPKLLDDPRPLQALRESYPMSHVIACSTAGEINGTAVKDDTLSVAVTRFDSTDLATEVVRVHDASESFAAGQKLGEGLARRPGLRAVFILSEGLKVNGSELVRGANGAVPRDVIVTGGLSGDGARFQRTWVSVNGEIASGLVAAVGFYGDHIVVTHGSRGGWDQFGPERIITKSTGNVIFEIDGQPALQLYKKYLGDKAKDLPGSGLLFPLEMRRDESDTKPLVRTLLAVDEAAQSLTFAGDTPQGHRVRLMKANFDRLVDGAATAGTSARPQVEVADGGCLAVAVSCVGRRLVLGARIEEEVEATQQALPKGTEIVGFYSYGELSPYVAGEACELHNQTMTVTTFTEAKAAVARESAPAPRAGRADEATVVFAAPPPGGRVQTVEYALKEKKWSAKLPPLDSPQTLVLAFGATGFLDDQAALNELRAAYPRSQVVGCSTSGEIAGTAVKDDSLSVAVYRFEKTTLRTEVAQVTDASQSLTAGRSLGGKLAQTPGLRAVFVLSEGLKVNGSELVRGVNDAVGADVIVTGGLSGDGPRFQRTWVTANGQTGSGLIAAVGLYGDHIQVSHGSRGGWDEFGPERIITKSTGNVIFEIDGQPALQLYKKYLADKAKDLPGSGLLFPLQIRRDESDDKALVRTLLAVDEAAQSLTFAGDCPQGHRVRLMKANFDRLVKGAGAAAEAVATAWLSSGAQAPEHLAIAISCVGRRLVLGARTEEEIEATLSGLPEDTKIVGFYSYGELSPYVAGAACELHNQTMTVTMLSETPTALAKPSVAARPSSSQPTPSAAPPAPPRPAPAPTMPVVAPPPQLSKTPTSPVAAALPGTGTRPPTMPASPAMLTGAPPAAAAPAPLPLEAVVARPAPGTPTSPPPPAGLTPAPGTPTSSPPAPAVTSVPSPFASTSPRPATGRFEIPRGKKPQAYPPQRGSTANARVVNRRVGNVSIVSVTGKLAEGFKGRDLGRELSGVVVLDLLGVERVTSYGVREWLAFLEEAGPRVSQLFLARCSEAIVAQLGMIRGFAGKAQILSVMAPYTCKCGTQTNGLLDMRAHGRDIAVGNIPSPTCPSCGRDDTEFDDDPRGYFVFQNDRPPQVPAEVDEALATLEARAVEAVEKTVDANATRIVVNAELDGLIRWQRILDGVEGKLSIDLQRSPRATAEGSTALVQALTRALSRNDSVELIAAPQELLPLLDTWPSSAAALTVTSAFVEGHCVDCNANRRVLLTVAEHLDAWKAGRDPSLLCPRHGRTLDVSRARALWPTLLPRERAPEPVAAATPASVAPAQATSATSATSAVPTPPALAPAAPAAPAAAPRNTVAWAAAAGVIGVVALLRWPASTPPATPAPALPPPPAAAPAAPADELPPDWMARPFVVDEATQEVFVVGKANGARTKERLLELATDDAVLRLVLQAEKAARPTATPTGDTNDEVFRERLRKRFDEGFGVFASPTRTEAFITERPEGFSGAFRFKLAKPALDKMVAQLSESVAPLAGFSVGRIRLTEAVALGTTDALVVVPGKGGAVDPAVRVGDTVHALNEEPVVDLQDFEKRLRNGYRNGRTMVVVFGRNGVLTEKRWRKPTENP